MNELLKNIIKQNQTIELKCENKSCKKITKVKTNDFLKRDSYVFICQFCNTETTYTNLKKFIKKLEKQTDKLQDDLFK